MATSNNEKPSLPSMKLYGVWAKSETKMPAITKNNLLKLMQKVQDELEGDAFCFPHTKANPVLCIAASKISERINLLENNSSYNEHISPYPELFWLKNFEKALNNLIPNKSRYRKTQQDFLNPILGSANLECLLLNDQDKSQVLEALRKDIPRYAMSAPAVDTLVQQIRIAIKSQKIEQPDCGLSIVLRSPGH